MRRDAARLQTQAHGERLHDGAGLKGVGHGAVAQLLATEVLPLGWHVTGVVGQRQHLAGDGIEHHHTARLGFVDGDGVAQFLVGKELHFAVNAELQVGAVSRWNGLAHRLNHATHAVLDDAARAGVSGQLFVESEFNALLPHVLYIGEAHHVRRCFALGVLTAVLLALVHALQTQGHDLLRHGLFHLALEPDKGLVFVGEFFLQLWPGHFQQFGQLLQLGFVAVNFFRAGPQAGHGHARCQDQTIAVQDAAAIGGQFQGACKAHLALLLEEVIGHHLDVERTPCQAKKAQRNRAHHKLAAPNRGAAGQQGAGGVGNAAAHGVAPVLTGVGAGCVPLTALTALAPLAPLAMT